MTAEHANGGADGRSAALIADDDANARQTLKAALEGRFQVIEARNGRDALKILHALPTPPALAILDLVMPLVGGLEVIAQLRRIAPQVPIVALASEGPAGADLLEVAARLGAVERLVKPVAASAVARLADKLLAA